MKSNYLVILFLYLFVSCSVNEENSIEDPQALVPTEEVTAETAESGDNTLGNNSSSLAFNSIENVASMLRRSSATSNTSTGLTVYYGANPVIMAFQIDNSRTLVLEIPGEDAKVTVMPNGRYKFKVQSTDPVSYIMDENYTVLYSNFCMENKQGAFNMNVISDANMVLGSDGFVQYNTIPPFFSANTLNYVTKLDNATFETDDYGLVTNCGNATDEVSVQLKKIATEHNQNNSQLKYRLTIR